MQRPSIGRTVIVKGYTSNGADEHPAIVTREWSDTCVNVMIFPDGADAFPMTSVNFFQTRDEAIASRFPLCAFFPERV